MNNKDKISFLMNSQTNILTKNIFPKLQIDLCQSQHSTSSSNSIHSSYKESPKNSDLFTFNKNFDNNCKKSLIATEDRNISQFSTKLL